MRIAIALCALCTGCVFEDADPAVDIPPPREPYGLVKTKAIAGELPVGGIDGDGAGGLWIAYFLHGWADAAHADVRLVHLDADGNKLLEHRWTEQTRPSGIAADGDTVWMNMLVGSFSTESTLRQIDASTGVTLRSIPMNEQVIDLDITGDELRLGTFDGDVIALDRTSGQELWRGTLIGAPEGYTGTARGFTTDDTGAMWMMSNGYWLERYTADLQPGGVFTGAPFEGHHTTAFDVFLAWDDGLIAATENQISWLAPRDGR